MLISSNKSRDSHIVLQAKLKLTLITKTNKGDVKKLAKWVVLSSSAPIETLRNKRKLSEPTLSELWKKLKGLRSQINTE